MERLLVLLSALLLHCAASAQLQVSRVQIRVLSGYGGKPIAHAGTSTLMLPETTFSVPIVMRTDRNGTASMLVLSTGKLEVTVPHHATCEYKRRSERKSNGPSAYSVQQILTSGVLGKDHCGHPRVQPTPGVLTVFVRPSHWWQRVGYYPF